MLRSPRERDPELGSDSGGRPPLSRRRKIALFATIAAVLGATVAGFALRGGGGSDSPAEAKAKAERERSSRAARGAQGNGQNGETSSTVAGNGAKSSTRTRSGRPSGSTNPTGSSNPTGPGAGSSAELGVFAGSPALTNEFGAWLGRSPKLVTVYLPADSWAQIDNPGSVLNGWAGTPWKLSIGVGMFPPGGSLAEGAAGSYDAHFRQLAFYLISKGWDDAILRIGWEFNGNWFRWRAKSDPSAFIGYWRRIVNTMRAVPGENFKFDWNPLDGEQEQRAAAVWPGDAYVDYVGINLYDNSWFPDTYPIPAGASASETQSRRAKVWDQKANGVDGLAYWARFAADHNKKLSMPEWAIAAPDAHGGGDNAFFIERVHDWITQHNLAYQSYFNSNGSLGDHRLTGATLWPAAASRFRATFG